MDKRNVHSELSEENLGAFVDGELDASAHARIEALLAEDAKASARVADLRRITQLVRDATHAAGRGAVPRANVVALRVVAEPPRRTRRPAWPSLRWVASFSGLALALVLGWQLFGPRVDAPGWQQSALVFHSSYLRARAEGKSHFLVDVTDLGSEDSANAYASIIDYEPVLPDLSAHDYAPTGTRLVTSPDGPTVFVIYEAPGRSPVGFSVIRATHRSAPATTSLRDVRLVSWSDGEFEYALSSDLSADVLGSLAETARRSLGGEPSLPVL